SRKREKRKQDRGKRGTIYEEAHLVDAIAHVIKRAGKQAKEVKELTQVLVEFDLAGEAAEMQHVFGRLVRTIDDNIDWVFDEARTIPGIDEGDEKNTVSARHPKPAPPGKTWQWVVLS